MPPTPKAVTIEKPETPPNIRTKLDEVWDKMNQGEQFFYTLDATVKGMAKAQTETQTDVRELRKQMRDHEKLNTERADAARDGLDGLRKDTTEGFKELDTRLDAVVRVQTEQGEQLRQLVAAEASRDAERKAHGEMLRRIDTALTARAAVEADRGAVSQPGDSPPLPSLSPTSPNLPALPPRRVSTPAVVAGGLGTVGLGALSLLSNSEILQWGLAVAMGILAIGAVMWALKNYAPRV